MSRDDLVRALRAQEMRNKKLQQERDEAVERYHKVKTPTDRHSYAAIQPAEWETAFYVLKKSKEFYDKDSHDYSRFEAFTSFLREHKKQWANGYLTTGLPELDYKELSAEQAADLRAEAIELTYDYFLSKPLGDPCE